MTATPAADVSTADQLVALSQRLVMLARAQADALVRGLDYQMEALAGRIDDVMADIQGLMSLRPELDAAQLQTMAELSRELRALTTAPAAIERAELAA